MAQIDIEKWSINPKAVQCTICGHVFIVDYNKPCKHLIELAKDCEAWIEGDKKE